MRLAAGQGLDMRPHSHIGLATVTYLFEGEILHRDSLTVPAEHEERAAYVAQGEVEIGSRWNFVSSRKERVAQAAADWQAGRFAPVSGETEFIPLPDGAPGVVSYP